MANTLDPMDLKQIITLHKDGLSNRKIGKTLGISRNTVNTYVSLLKSSEHDLEDLLHMDSHALREHFPSHTTIVNKRYNDLMLFLEQENMAKNHPGFTFLHHYNEYKLRVENPYSYTQFMEHHNQKYSRIKGSMKLEHKAGHELFVDFAGSKLHYVDKSTGELIETEVLVVILPCSQYTYIEACYSQKREDMIPCIENSLRFYGGVPKAIVSDNLKSAVTRSSKYEAIINKTFKDFARHYNCVINPTRSYSPQDKALVENAVNLVYQNIYYPIREMTFFSLEDLNAEIRKRLDKYNDLMFQRKEASRRELFQSIERSYLKPLASSPYQIKDYTRAKVQKIGYVYFSPDKSYYSVPYRYIGKSTQVQYTRSTVEVYVNHERIASHQRNPSRGTYNTNKDHLSSQHRAYTEWSPDFFMKKAARHGEHVQACIENILNTGDYPETQYKRSMGIIQLHREYGSKRLNEACGIAINAGTYSYHRIKNILKNKLDLGLFAQEEPPCEDAHIPLHDNIRGASSYQ